MMYRTHEPVSIIVPGYGRAATTLACIESIRQYTPEPAYRLYYIDNGTDNFSEIVAQYEKEKWFAAVRLPINHGFVRAINYGLSLAVLDESEYVLLLNNDVEVPEGDTTWLIRLLNPFVDAEVGAVGAVSDGVCGYQKRDGAGDRFVPAPFLTGFAMAIRKQALKQIGLFDERFEPGNYEDVDYSLRMTKAGWRLIIAESVWLRHEMHAAMQTLNFAELLYRNRGLFVEKWGTSPEELSGENDSIHGSLRG